MEKLVFICSHTQCLCPSALQRCSRLSLFTVIQHSPQANVQQLCWLGSQKPVKVVENVKTAGCVPVLLGLLLFSIASILLLDHIVHHDDCSWCYLGVQNVFEVLDHFVYLTFIGQCYYCDVSLVSDFHHSFCSQFNIEGLLVTVTVGKSTNIKILVLSVFKVNIACLVIFMYTYSDHID